MPHSTGHVAPVGFLGLSWVSEAKGFRKDMKRLSLRGLRSPSVALGGVGAAAALGPCGPLGEDRAGQ